MIYAPVLIPTLCRFDHFKNCIESLQKNPFSKYTDLYIGLDYPLNDSQFDGYNRISAYIDKGIKGFNKVKVYKRKTNYGVVGNHSNLFSLVDSAKSDYDRVIISEDDNIFSPCFLEYMDKALELSENDPDVIAVCGYSYPIEWEDDGKEIIKLQSFFSAWGFGCFVDSIIFDDKYFSMEYRSKQIIGRNALNIYKKSKKNFCYFINLCWKNDQRKHDIAWSSLMLLENKYCLMPSISLVRNCGWDGTGENCKQIDNINYNNQYISDKLHFKVQNIDKLEHLSLNETKINLLYKANFYTILKSIVKYVLLFIKYRIKTHS